MGNLKKKLLFLGLSTSAYISPALMFLSLFTNYWLHSIETVVVPTTKDRPTTTTSTFPTGFYYSSNITKFIATKNTTIKPFLALDHIEAMYGLWEMCKIIDTSGIPHCETIKHFKGGSDSEIRLTDILKRQIGICIVPILAALALMASSVILHTYACLRNKMPHLFLISGCIFIFAGLASLTGLIVFIAAVNGAVDSQLTASQMSEEPPFVYRYGISFFCAIFSFLMQEFNGICNVYWYVGHYSKYRYGQNNFMKTSEFDKQPGKPNKMLRLTSNENLLKIGEKNAILDKTCSADNIKIGFGSNNLKRSNETQKNKTQADSNFYQENSNQNNQINDPYQANNTIEKNLKHKRQNKTPNDFNIKCINNTVNDHMRTHFLPEKPNFPPIKYIIDDRLSTPLTLNILPKSYETLLKSSIQKSKSSMNCNSNSSKILKGSTNNILLTDSQSTTPQNSSLTISATSQDESSLPHSVVTTTSSTSNTLTFSPESSVTESVCSIGKKNIAQLGLAASYKSNKIPIENNIGQFKNYKIDFENDIDDLKAKFYKIIKTNPKNDIEYYQNEKIFKNDNRKNLKPLNNLDPKYSKSFDENYNFCPNNYNNRQNSEYKFNKNIPNLNNHEFNAGSNRMNNFYQENPLLISEFKLENNKAYNKLLEQYLNKQQNTEINENLRNVLMKNVSQKQSFQIPKRMHTEFSNEHNINSRIMNESFGDNNFNRQEFFTTNKPYHNKNENICFLVNQNLLKKDDKIIHPENFDSLNHNNVRNNTKKLIDSNSYYYQYSYKKNPNLIEYNMNENKRNDNDSKYDQDLIKNQFNHQKNKYKVKQELNKPNQKLETTKNFLNNTLNRDYAKDSNYEVTDDFSKFYILSLKDRQLLHLINTNSFQTSNNNNNNNNNFETNAQRLRKNMRRTTSV